MQRGRGSRTAKYVTLLRALGDRGLTSAEGFRDPTARALLSAPWTDALEWLVPKIARLSRRLRERIVARIDFVVLRALAIDAELTKALAAGCQQVVILGAGFDGRAHRMAALEGAHVFEVDHPATQSIKRLRAANLPRACRALTYVACDFERDPLGECLRSAGHRSDIPTFWIWEGVTLYLTDEALHATLATLAALSATNSVLIVEYHDAEAATSDALYAFTRKILLALWSEPQIGARSQSRFQAELERAGLAVEKDFSVSEWGATFARATPRPRYKRARLAVTK